MRGHRTVPHTADLRVEAWGASREDCLAEAVLGLVASFADIEQARPARTVARHLTADCDEDLLVELLDEVIYGLDVTGELPVSARVRPAADGGVDVELGVVPATTVELVGAVPKAVSLNELRVERDASGSWSCAATIDV